MIPGSYNLQLSVIADGDQRALWKRILKPAGKDRVACSWAGSFEVQDKAKDELPEDYREAVGQATIGTYSALLKGNQSELGRGNPTATLGRVPPMGPTS